MADENWKDGFPDDIKNHPSMENLDGVESLAKSWVNAQKLIGKEKLPMPTGPEDKDAWETVFSRLGRPETAENYDVSQEGVPKEIPVEDNFLSNFKTKSFELGLLPNQVQGLFNWWVDSEKGVLEEMTKLNTDTTESAKTELRQEWGKAYDQNVKLASSVITKFGGKATQDLLTSDFANDPKIIKLLSSVGKVLSEDNLLGEKTGFTLTPAEAQKEINEIQGDLKHPYHLEGHPEHKSSVDYVQSLFKMLYPENNK